MSVTKKPVGNKTTEVILGSAAAKIQAAVVSLNSAIEVVGKLDEKANESVLQVSNLEDKIGALTQDLANKTAQNKIEVEQAYNADKEAFVDKYLHERKLETIDANELEELKDKVARAEENTANAVRSAVGTAVGIEQSKSASALKIAELGFAAKEAQNTAEINQAKSQIKFLEEQVQMWKGALDDERKAGVERSKAGAVGTINVGQPGQR